MGDVVRDFFDVVGVSAADRVVVGGEDFEHFQGNKCHFFLQGLGVSFHFQYPNHLILQNYMQSIVLMLFVAMHQKFVISVTLHLSAVVVRQGEKERQVVQDDQSFERFPVGVVLSHRERLQDVVQDFDDVVLLRDQERRENSRGGGIFRFNGTLSYFGWVVCRVMWFLLDIVLVSVSILEGDLLLFLGLSGDIFRGLVDLHHEQDMFRGLVVIVKVYRIDH